MKKVDKTKVVLWICSIVLLITTTVFYLKWNARKSISEAITNTNKNFDKLYASGYFQTNIDFVQKTMLFKVKRVRKVINKNEIKNENDLTLCKTMMDSLRVSLNADVKSINDTIKFKFRSGDTIGVYLNSLVIKTHNIKLQDGKSAFYSILDTLDFRIKSVKN
jgi:hypothetical protein